MLRCVYDGTHVSFTMNDWTASSFGVYIRGTPLANGTIAWDTSMQTIYTGQWLSGPDMGVDSNGYPWVSVCLGGDTGDTTISYSGGSITVPYRYGDVVMRSSTNNGVFTMDTAHGFPMTIMATPDGGLLDQKAIFAPLPGGNMEVIYGATNFGWKGQLFSNTTDTFQVVQTGFMPTAVFTASSSITQQGNTIFFASLDGSFNVDFNTYTLGVGWGTAQTMFAGTGTATPILSISPTGILTMFWINSPSANVIYYMQRSASGIWGSPTILLQLTQNIALKTSIYHGGDS